MDVYIVMRKFIPADGEQSSFNPEIVEITTDMDEVARATHMTRNHIMDDYGFEPELDEDPKRAWDRFCQIHHYHDKPITKTLRVDKARLLGSILGIPVDAEKLRLLNDILIGDGYTAIIGSSDKEEAALEYLMKLINALS